MTNALLDRIVADPAICFGKPTIRGHRLWVSLILGYLAEGWTVDAVVAELPGIEVADVLVTSDLDFANQFVFDPRPTVGAVVLRLPKAHGPTEVLEAVDRLTAALQEHPVEGGPWIVSSSGIRRFVPPS